MYWQILEVFHPWAQTGCCRKDTNLEKDKVDHLTENEYHARVTKNLEGVRAPGIKAINQSVKLLDDCLRKGKRGWENVITAEGREPSGLKLAEACQTEPGNYSQT